MEIICMTMDVQAVMGPTALVQKQGRNERT